MRASIQGIFYELSYGYSNDFISRFRIAVASPMAALQPTAVRCGPADPDLIPRAKARGFYQASRC